MWIWKKKIGWGEFKEDILVYLFILLKYLWGSNKEIIVVIVSIVRVKNLVGWVILDFFGVLV